MDGLTFIAIAMACGTVCFVTDLLVAHLSDQGARRHAERMTELQGCTCKDADDEESREAA